MKDQAVPDESGLWREQETNDLYAVLWNRTFKCWDLTQLVPPRGFAASVMPEAFPAFIIQCRWVRVRKDPQTVYYKRRPPYFNG